MTVDAGDFEIVTTTTIEYSEFGVAVSVPVPPEDQVVPFAEVREQFAALLRGDTSALTG